LKHGDDLSDKILEMSAISQRIDQKSGKICYVANVTFAEILVFHISYQ